MRILHTSDWHVGRRIRGRDRSDEHRDVLAEIAGIAAAKSVDLSIVAGDVFDTTSPSPTAEKVVWKALLDLAEVSPVLVVAGNHDNPARLDAVTPLLEMGRVTTVGTARGPQDGGLVHLEDIGVKAALLPFVSQRGIVRVNQIMTEDPDQHAGDYAERMAAIVGKLTEGMGPDTVNIFAGHLTVFGALSGGGERQAHIFGYAIPSSLFPGHLSYVALGHLHRQQKMPHSSPVWYSGSPLQLDFGEVEDRKGVLLVDAEPGLPATVTSVPLVSGKELRHVKGTLEQVKARAEDLGQAYVKVELEEKARVGLADEVRDAIPDAVEVILQAETVEKKAVDKRRTLEPAKAFHEYLTDRGVDDSELETLFSELLDQVSGS